MKRVHSNENLGFLCIICNTAHFGTDPDLVGHKYTPTEGVGYVRLLCIGVSFADGKNVSKTEHCWRCSCVKSSWANVPNQISNHCTDKNCICHLGDEVVR